MTNTKFRKRALLSSVAMLLVALVALGSATFAWFTEDPNADASGINAYAQTSKGLLIKTDTDTTASHHATLAKNVSGIYLAPATTNDGQNYKTIEAASASDFKLNPAKTWQGATMVDHVAGTGVYQETMKLEMTSQPTGSDTQPVYLKGVEIELQDTAHKMKDALIVTLVYTVGGTKTVKHYAQSATTVTSWADFTAAPVAEPTGTAAASLNVAKAETGLSEQVGTFSASVSEVDVEVYVWLNGQHSSVYSDNSDPDQLIKSVKCSYSLNA